MIIILLILGLFALFTVFAGGGIYYWLTNRANTGGGGDGNTGDGNTGGNGGNGGTGNNGGDGGPPQPPPLDANVVGNGSIIALEDPSGGWLIAYPPAADIKLDPFADAACAPGADTCCMAISPPCYYWFIVKVNSSGAIDTRINQPIYDGDIVRLYHLASQTKHIEPDHDNCLGGSSCAFQIRKREGTGVVTVDDIVDFREHGFSETYRHYLIRGDDNGEWVGTSTGGYAGDQKSQWRIKKVGTASQQNTAYGIMNTLQ